jgi:hypothetical protein
MATTLALFLTTGPALAAPSKAAKPPPAAKPGALGHHSGIDSDASMYLGNPKTEAAVDHALAYLAKIQAPDGSWNGPGNGADVGIVGLSVMAYLSAGHQPDRGKYGEVLRKATDYLCRQAQPTGLIANPGRAAGPPMYGHGFATLALAELWGMTQRPDLRDKLEKAVRLILSTQNHQGGWRYQPRVDDADISVTICQIMALRAAANAGIAVPEETTSHAIAYVKLCSNKKDGGFVYQGPYGESGQARTGAGVLALLIMGQRDSTECQRGLEYLSKVTPGVFKEHWSYAAYYCTQAMFQAGGEHWKSWYPRMADSLLSKQKTDGSWETEGIGRAYCTAMGVLTLQVPSGLLPVYQR